MDGWFSRSFIKAASASGGFSFPSAGRLPPAHRRLKGESALPGVGRAKVGWQALLRCCHRIAGSRSFTQPGSIHHADGGGKPGSMAPPHIAALSAALNADKGARARAVHLVIVEQTLRQGVWGGLNAVPAAVLAQAMPQLARLSRFRTSLELQLLFQCMHEVVEAHGQPAGPGTTPPGTQDGGFIIKRPGPDLTAGARLESPETDSAPRRNLSNPVGHADRDDDDDDDFPDTKAFDDEEVPVPKPPVDQGAAMGVSEAPMPAHSNRRLRLGHAGFIHTF
jgi:hypothetical protein